MSKRSKQYDERAQEKEEHARHIYKVQKKEQARKMLKNLDRALRNKDYGKLVNMDDY